MSLRRLGALVIACACLSSCVGASPAQDGGTDAFAPNDAFVPSDAFVPDDAFVPSDAGAATWSGLYTDYFGPAAVAHCGTGPGCHESATATGAITSNFVCVDSASCYASLTGISHLVRPSDMASPASAPLFHSLRIAGNTGRMPLNVGYTFGPNDVARIEAWIARGAMND